MTVGLVRRGRPDAAVQGADHRPRLFHLPVISLSPAITIALSFVLLRERTGKLGALGIVLALVALPLFDLSFGQVHAEVWAGSRWRC